MTRQTLPPGSIDIVTHAIHVAQLRRHTTDLQRFLRLLPYARQLDGVAPALRKPRLSMPRSMRPASTPMILPTRSTRWLTSRPKRRPCTRKSPAC